MSDIETSNNPILDQDQGEEQVEDLDLDLDNPLRIILVIDHPNPKDKELNEMEERLIDSIQSFKQMDFFFDEFDTKIAMPNESHIKYEVGSDGLVVIIVDNLKLRDEVLTFIDGYGNDDEANVEQDDNENSLGKNKKKQKN